MNIKRKIYIALTDISHAFTGIATVILLKSAKYDIYSNIVLISLAFTLMIAFITYQVFDDDPPEEKTSDLIEYAVGLIIGSAL